MTRTRLFLDVDGVLNPFGEHALTTFDDFVTHRPMGFRIRLSRRMGARLAALDVEIHWLTTWQHRADEHVADLLDLPRGLPVCELDGLPHGKERALRRVVEPDRRPFVWIDDDAIPPRGPSWAEEHGIAHLLVRTDAATGLTPDQLDEIAAFAARQERDR